MRNFLSSKTSHLTWNSLSFVPKRSMFQKNPKILPDYPKKSLFSSVLENPFSEEQRKMLEKEFAIKVNAREEEEKELRPFKKISDFQLTRSDYMKINQENPMGNFFK